MIGLATALRLSPYAAAITLAIALFLTRADLAHLRSANKLAVASQHLADAQARLADSERVAGAVATYAARQGALQPIILHSIETVTRYAQTPAGRAPCLDAERVLGIDALDAAIAASASTGGNGAVLTDTSASSAQRSGDRR